MVAQAESTPTLAGTSRRRELIAATIAATAEHGLSGLTLAKVAGHAGLTAAAVSFHFNSKEALLQATLQSLADEFERALRSAVADAGDDPGGRLLALVDVMLDPTVSDPARVSVWYAFLSESQAREAYQRVCGDLDRTYDRIVSDLFAKLLAGHSGHAIDPSALAGGLVGLLESEWQGILFSPGDYDRAAAKQRCRAYLASTCPFRFQMPRLPAAAREIASAAVDRLSESLPAWTYENDEFFELERERIFLPSWQIVCHANDVANPGDYATFEMLSERALVIRGKDGKLRAFHNVCRHRAHAVVSGERGSCKHALRCPYHGWTYGLDGHLKAAPGKDGFRDFERGKYGLVPLDLEVFAGFVFIRFQNEGPGVAERLAPYAAELAHYRLEEMIPLDDAVWFESHEIDWKNVMDNYLEDYHFPMGHPGLSSLMERDYDREVSATGVARLSHRMKSELQSAWSVRHYQKLLPACEHLPEELRRRWSYVSMFPGVSLEVYADKAGFFQVLPTGPGRCLLRGRNYGLPDESREMRAARYLADRINAQVQREDNRLTDSVQRGLRSSSYQVGVLCDKEGVTKGFQDWIRERIPVSQLAGAPARGSVADRNRELSHADRARSSDLAVAGGELSSGPRSTV
jgi:phenylpropionate dioxygenase-like ring-hydroxylating dioxygenase large terminal subunit/DNA-binding transcriptional regulator YbjK